MQQRRRSREGATSTEMITCRENALRCSLSEHISRNYQPSATFQVRIGGVFARHEGDACHRRTQMRDDKLEAVLPERTR